MASEPATDFNPNDPHNFAELGEHHGHHIASKGLLITVILALVALTALTVGVSEIETYLVKNMGWYLPDWINVAVAMSIALVKGALVLMFFMALRYENPLYTIVFLFCMFAFALFLGLTGMDLDNRGHAYEWKQESISVGGTGVSVNHAGATIKVHGETVEIPSGSFSGSLAEHLRDTYIAQTGISEAEYRKRWEYANHKHHDHHDLSSADRSVARTGLSGALDETTDADAKADDHGDGH